MVMNRTDSLGMSKIGQNNTSIRVPGIYQYVVRLDIAVDYAVIVQIIYSSEYLQDYDRTLCVSQALVLVGHERKEISASDQFLHDIASLLLAYQQPHSLRESHMWCVVMKTF